MPLDHARGDVARHQPHHRKDDDAHEEQRRNREGEAAKEVALHLSGQVYAQQGDEDHERHDGGGRTIERSSSEWAAWSKRVPHYA
jgi:hypothetical protein